MACDGCERTVEQSLEAVDGVRRVEADHETETVDAVVEEDVGDDELGSAVRDAGYEVAP